MTGKAGEWPLSSWGRGPTTSAGCRLPVYRYLQLIQPRGAGGEGGGVPEARPVCHRVFPLLPREEPLQTFCLQLHPAPPKRSLPCAARAARSRGPGFPGKRVCPRVGAARVGRLLGYDPTALARRPRCFRGALHTSPLLAPRRPGGQARLEPAALSRELLRNSCEAGWRHPLPWKLHAPPEAPRPARTNRDLSRQGRPWKPSEPGGGEGTSQGGQTSLSVRKCF